MSDWTVGAYVSDGITWHDVVDEHGNCRGTFMYDKDAMLMCAARDLLAACEAVIAHEDDFSQIGTIPPLDLMRAAIARARGEV